jgi:hypothetical protein
MHLRDPCSIQEGRSNFSSYIFFNQGKYLKDGSGKPWAGQSNDKAPLIIFSNVPKLFESDENFGPAPPIGSKGFKIVILK